MKFPITRESLQAFNYIKDKIELREEVLQKVIPLIVDVICKEFKKNMRSNSLVKKFVLEFHKLNANADLAIIQNNLRLEFGYNIEEYFPSYIEYLPSLIDKLKELFIGCDIIIDPLKTYLIIDWS